MVVAAFEKLTDCHTVILQADQHTDPELASSGHKGRETGEADQPQ